jgi:hypothetical protein
VDVKWNGPLYPFNIEPGMHVYTCQPFIFNSLIWWPSGCGVNKVYKWYIIANNRT